MTDSRSPLCDRHCVERNGAPWPWMGARSHVAFDAPAWSGQALRPSSPPPQYARQSVLGESSSVTSPLLDWPYVAGQRGKRWKIGPFLQFDTES